MDQRKLDVSPGAGGKVGVKRSKFDEHINHCTACQPELCNTAQTLWRETCVAALRVRRSQS